MSPLRTGGDWTGELRAAGLLTVAGALGMDLRAGRSLSPCPACGAERRGRGDRRGPIGVRRDGLGWHCHRCRAHGDAVTLACWRRFGASMADPGRWSELRGWASDAGLIRPSATGRGISARPAAPAAPAWVRPPEVEVQALWKSGLPAASEPASARWFRARQIDGAEVAKLDIARVLPIRSVVPSWARYLGRAWSLGHRLIVPLYDAEGRVRSLHARALGITAPGGRGKAASPAGFDVGGLTMANPAGVALLRGEASSAVVVVEGVPDFLAWAVAAKDAPILGVLSGTWSEAFAERIRHGAYVEVRTHADVAGEKYAETIAASLGSRALVTRRPPDLDR